jgi:hypothetical protein
MILFKIFPDWLFYLVPMAGLIGLLLSQFLPNIVYAKLLKIVSAILLLAGIYFVGSLHANQNWQQKALELENKVKLMESESKTTNAEIETKIVTKTQVVKQRGETVIRYIDREVVKIDERCTIPPEFVDAHNKAATK